MAWLDLLRANPQWLTPGWRQRCCVLQKLVPTQETQTDGILTSPHLFMLVPPILSFASSNRSFWNTAAITHSIVKGRTVAILERNATLSISHQAPFIHWWMPNTTHMGPRPKLWVLFSNPHIWFFLCIFNLLHQCFRVNSSRECRLHISFNSAIKALP